MKGKSRFLRVVMAYSLSLIIVLAFFAIAKAQPSRIDSQVDAMVELSERDNIPEDTQSVDKTNDKVDPNEPHVYIVVLDDTPLASYRGHISGLSATNPQAKNTNKLDAKSPESVAYLDYLAGQRAAAVDRINSELGRDVVVGYEYGATIVGFSTEMSAVEAAQVEMLPGVWFVEREKISQLMTDAGPAWINAPDIWNSTVFTNTRGEGVIVGVIDSSIDPWNPSFADVGDDGYDHDNPFGSGTYVGVCDPSNTGSGEISPYDPTFPCNDKLIGAWGFDSVTGGDARGSGGHGSHTASTAAGNVVYGAVITTPTDVFTADISGVAPHANIIAYTACCTGAALAAARDQALIDGVDIINYSIGSSGATVQPWQSAQSLQWLALRDANVFVATSAGNNGNGAATLGSPGDIPWITTVGASSHNRTFLNSLVAYNGGGMQTFDGIGMTGPLTQPAEIVLSSWYTAGGTIDSEDARLCADGIFPPGTFNGEIVICERGSYGRVAKGQTVKDGGAGGYILAQPDQATGGPGAVATDPHVLPGLHIDYYTYQDLLDFMGITTTVRLQQGGTITGTITGATLDVDDKHGDVMASFSSRGPNRAIADIVVPNVTAPGRGVWAAHAQGPNGDGDYTFNVIQGTSMSSPHVAGAGALLRAVHPSWSPAEIESALMTTAIVDILDDDGVNRPTPFSQGSGRVDVYRASMAGIVLDETEAGYLAGDPDNGGDPKDINLASFGNSQCLGTCSWTRTVKSTLALTQTWVVDVDAPPGAVITVTPSTFDLAPGATQDIDVTIDVTDVIAEPDSWVFGSFALYPDAVPSSIECNSSVHFESNSVIPSDWPVFQGPGVGWGATNDGFCSSSGDYAPGNFAGTGEAACIDSRVLGSYEDSYLCTPLLDLGGVVTAELDFLVNYQIFGGTTPTDVFELLLTPDATTFYTTGFSVDSDFPSGGTAVPNSGVPVNVDITGIVSSTMVHACFHYTADDEWYAHVDDVSLSCDYGGTKNAGIPTVPEARFPIAVIPVGSIVPPDVNIMTDMTQGSEMVPGIVSVNNVMTLTADVSGLTIGTQVMQDLDGDSDNSSPYDDLSDGAFWVTTTVPANAQRLVAETLDVDDVIAPGIDLDLFVGTGNMPSAGTQVCSSTSPTEIEYCNIDDPAAGTWWILVQNWQASANAPDPVTLVYGVVAGAEGNMTVTGPNGVPAGTPFDIDVSWDEPALVNGDIAYGAFTLGTGPDDDNIGRSNVKLTYNGDEPSEIVVSPDALDIDVEPDSVVTYSLTISNVGEGPLDWSVSELDPTVVLKIDNSDQVIATSNNSASETVSFVASNRVDEGSVEAASLEEVTNGAIPLVLDDGSRENGIGLTGGSQIIWLNQFTPDPGEYPFFLNEIHVLFSATDGVNIGEIIDLYVYEDADGNPDNGVTQVGTIQDVTVQVLDEFSIYVLDTPVGLAGPGDVLIGVVNRTAGTDDGEFPAAIDQTASQGRSWIGSYGGDVPEPPTIPASSLWGVVDSFGANLAGNWMVRGLGSAASVCDFGQDTSWLHVTPISGTTAAGAYSHIYVSFDSTGLSGGVYTSTLCVQSNDPVNPETYVPITMTVQADGDGISDDEENGAPNGGDGNGDGIADSTQNHVASLIGRNDGQYVTVEIGDGAIDNISSSEAMTLPTGVEAFPEGLFDFVITDIMTGSSVMVTMTLHSGIEPDSYWKWDGEMWYELEDAEIMASPVFTDTYIVQFTLVDGGVGDWDGEANGVIVDPSAPAFSSSGGIYLPIFFNN